MCRIYRFSMDAHFHGTSGTHYNPVPKATLIIADSAKFAQMQTGKQQAELPYDVKWIPLQ